MKREERERNLRQVVLTEITFSVRALRQSFIAKHNELTNETDRDNIYHSTAGESDISEDRAVTR